MTTYASDQFMSFTPDHGWVAHFEGASETWTEPVIGWAIVSWAGVDGRENDIQAVVLDEERYPSTIHGYLIGREGVKFLRLTRAEVPS